MDNPLRQKRAVTDWAKSSQVIEISDKIHSFDGLCAVIEADLAALESDEITVDWRNLPVTGEVRFSTVTQGPEKPVMTGWLKTRIAAVCQRCLKVFELTLSIEPALVFRTDDTVADQHEGYDDWELESDVLCPLDVVEELLLMAMPFAATHEDETNCNALPPSAESADAKTIRPFAALRSQMQEKS